LGEPSEREQGILEKLSSSLAGSVRIFYYPIVVRDAKRCTITDVNGKEYLDFNASWTVAGLGYSNPEVISAIKEELDLSAGLATVTFPNERVLKFAEELLRITPGNFAKKVWFGHSGGDACAAAYKLIPMATKRPRVVTFFGGMHGVDLAGIAMGGHPSTLKYHVPSLVTKVPYAYCYRCPFGLEYPSCGVYCASDFIEDQVFKYACPPEDTSFMLAEPMQSDGGDIVPPKEYLSKLKKTCDRFGILFAADEVKVAPSRTGKLFAVEDYGVIPDAVALGKSIASGMPVGALVAKDDLLEGAYLSSTLAGNAIVAAAGAVTLRLLSDERLIRQVSKLGDLLRARVGEMKEKHELIGDVRGKGLFLGVEFVKDRDTKEPAPVETAKVVYQAWKLGLLTVFVGPDKNVLELTPPLVITEDEVTRGLDILERAISDVEKGLVSDSAVSQSSGF
jgi:4-aminobutyrate aminotransferase